MNDEPPQSVGVVGTGTMGAPIARNLAASGFEVYAWNRTVDRVNALDPADVKPVEHVVDLAGCDVVVTMLSDAAAVEAAMVDSGLLGAMGAGSVWLQMSTIGPRATRALMERCALAGPAFVDAPVLGTKQPAEQAALTVLLSGDAGPVARSDGVLAAVSAKRLVVGSADEASRLKLVVNAWLLGMVGALAESLTLAEDLELDPDWFLQAIEGSAVDTPYAQLKGPAMLKGSFPPSFPLRLAHKDARLLLQEEAVAGTRKAFAEAAAEALDEAMRLELGDLDVAAVAQVYRER